MTLKNILEKIMPYTLLIAISGGYLVFLLFHYISLFAPLKPIAYSIYDSLAIAIFIILFFAFCKINFKQMKPKKWQFYLVAIQLIVSTIIAFYISRTGDPKNEIFLCGTLICAITPTAASASVITGKLGGSESALTTYIILSNLAAAIGIPLLFPLITNSELNFLAEFVNILNKVFPIIVLPLVCAVVIKLLLPRLHRFIVDHTKSIGFYLWACILFVLSAKTFSNIAAARCSHIEIYQMALIGALCTAVQFSLGKLLGNFEKQRISAGQGLGQKNMLFGIWVAMTYLTPTVAIIPGTYILWQNLVNAWQMWHRERLLITCQKKGITPYQEE